LYASGWRSSGKLSELQDLFIEEAIKNDILPLDDHVFERFNAEIAGRPDLTGNRTSLTVYPGMTHMTENAFINVKNRSHTITTEVEIPQGGGEGVILAQGGHSCDRRLCRGRQRVHTKDREGDGGADVGARERKGLARPCAGSFLIW